MAEKLEAKKHDLGGMFVKRVIPQVKKRMVGPFIFFDHMGPGDFPAGKGINVRSHPHIGLSTLTYLFTGSILHRDSLGNHQEIHPGDVNWMTAGRGIVHSERETFEVRANPHSIDGLQVWIALPKEYAELEPSFTHIKKEELPQIIHEEVMIRLVAGEAYNLSSPLKTYSPMFYLDVVAGEGSKIKRPNPGQECAIYVTCGKVEAEGEIYEAGDFVLLSDDGNDDIIAVDNTRFIMIGGEKWEEVPYIHWNFVSFSKERIEQAKEDWKNGRFPPVPGDDKEHIPLPTR